MGISQSIGYDEPMEAEIGGRVRARMQVVLPSGTTQAEIAERIRLTPDAFSRSLNGKRAFTAIELVDLAALLNTSAHWLITGEADPLGARVAGRHDFDRSNGTYTLERWADVRSDLGSVVLAYTQAFAAGTLTESIATLPTELTAEACSEALRAHGGEHFIRRLAHNVEGAFGVDVVRIADLGGDFVLDVVGRSVIVVNETGNWFRENFGMLHELAHLVNGDLADLGEDMCSDSVAEGKANSFAASVLMPESAIRAADWGQVTLHELAQLVWDLGVSTEALAARLSRLRIELRPELSTALALKTQALLRRARVPESDGDEVSARMDEAATRRFPVHLIAAHRAGVADGTILPGVLAWMLGVDVESITEELAPAFPDSDIDALGRELGLLG